MKRSAVVLVLACLAGCDEKPTGVASDRVYAVKETSGIRLDNLTDRPSGYFIVDRNTLALIDWAPCVSLEPTCLRLPANGSVIVPFDEIVMGGAQSLEVNIYVWWVVPDPFGEPRADIAEPMVLKF